MHGVIFDMDGVLILTADAHFQSWRDTAARHGVEVDYEKFIRMFGRTNPDIIRAWWGERTPIDLLDRIAHEKELAFRELIARKVPLAPGCEALLRELKEAGVTLAVGSSAPIENIALVLDEGGIRWYFSAVVDGSEVRRGKPAPDVFLLAADRLGLPPVRCAVIEDAPAGIAAAISAGTIAVGVAATHKASELEAVGADFVAPSLADLTCERILSMLRRE